MLFHNNLPITHTRIFKKKIKCQDSGSTKNYKKLYTTHQPKAMQNHTLDLCQYRP